MVDPDLPVRYSASLALSRFLSWEVSKSQLSSEIKSLLTIYLKLIEETDSEEVIESLESIISVFPSEMQPFACELTQFLISNFEKYTQEKKDDNNLPAFSTLNTISKIVEVISDDSETLVKLGVLLKPLLEKLVMMKDYTEEFCNILSGILFSTPNNALEELYSVFKAMWLAVLGLSGDGSDYLIDPGNTEDIFPCFANFITKFPEKSLENIEGIIVNTCKLLRIDEDFMFLACQILLVVLENFRDSRVKLLMNFLISEISSVFQQDHSKKYKIACCQVIFTLIWNSPDICIGSYPAVRPFLMYASSNLKYFAEYLAKIHLILGLASVFTLVQIPQEVLPDLPGYFKVLFETAKETKYDELNSENIRKVHNVDLQLNWNVHTHDSSSEEEEDYDDYPYGIEPVNNFTFYFESQDPTETYKKFIDFLRGREDLNALFSQLNANDEVILSYIIK
jgi:hypothetical protein